MDPFSKKGTFEKSKKLYLLNTPFVAFATISGGRVIKKFCIKKEDSGLLFYNGGGKEQKLELLAEHLYDELQKVETIILIEKIKLFYTSKGQDNSL